MKRIFAKCFLQKHGQAQNNNSKQQSNTSKTLSLNENKNCDAATIDEKNCGHWQHDSVPIIQQNGIPFHGNNLPDQHVGNAKITYGGCNDPTFPNGPPTSHDKGINKPPSNHLMHSFKPDLLTHGSPAKKRTRSSRSNSRSVSFICVEAAENSDDEDDEDLSQDKGNILIIFKF